ncbi:MAG: zf-HC2 domain-containing protein [Acidobacteriota bacterium]
MSHAAHSMSCREMADCLSDYLDGELQADLRALIDEHRGECPPCEAFIRTLVRTVEAIRAQPREPLSADLRKSLADSLRRARRR